MSITVAVQHQTHYEFDRPVALSPHLIRLRPAAHCRTPIQSYSLKISPDNYFINWQQDPFGNYVARVVFPEKVSHLHIDVEVIADMTIINPFDFFVEESAEHYPFAYDDELRTQLQPYLQIKEDGPLLKDWLSQVARDETPIVNFLVALNQRLQHDIGYLIREEPGVQSCEQTLSLKTGSCRDSAWLLVQILRHLGLAARFVSGYLVQLRADTEALDGPSGPSEDFTDLHAWAEVYVPGAGWVGLDPTSGLFAGEGHIPLSCTPSPSAAAPVSGLLEPCESRMQFLNRVMRIEERPRVTAPLSEADWQAAMHLGEQVDAVLQEHDVRLTQGGEPTFIAIDYPDDAEWHTAAMGPNKARLARQLLRRLQARFAPQGVLHHGQGKWYPGEQLPRWAFNCYFRTDGHPLWHEPALISPEQPPGHSMKDARKFLQTLCQKLRVPSHAIMPAYEDAAWALRSEASLPEDIDLRDTNLNDPLERKRLAKLLDKGLSEASGLVLPLAWSSADESWHAAPWPLRRGRLILMSGDSPVGYRLPLESLPWQVQKNRQKPERDSFEPRPPLLSAEDIAQHYSQTEAPSPAQIQARQHADDDEDVSIPHTALCVEIRDGRLWVFLPPLSHLEHFIELITKLEATAKLCNLAIELEGYEPPHDPRLRKFAITPDPGVIEVNIHPAASWQELVENTQILYEEARLCRLSAEKFMLDGRHVGTGGGNHVTLGASEPADSPFLRRPDLLASLVLYWQHHPALSYLFSGLFIGPTSQAPRIDEARDDTLYDLEIALQQLAREETISPWVVDRLFRNILVDMTGNTHRAEFCIDKLYNPGGPTGRLGLLELRAFEMPPHYQMSAVQMLLLRALVARFWQTPYTGRPAYWGATLHDRFLLPHYVEQDFNQVIAELRDAGFDMERSWFDAFFSFRFPFFGELCVRDIRMELRAAIEPWNVLGEEVSAQGTSRYVDSSVERMQVKINQWNPQRYALCCNGRRVPLQACATTGDYVAGIRFKAWQPAFGLHPRLPAHQQLVFDVVDLANQRSIAGCTYYVSHPGGRNFEQLPVNANEAEARRVARFEARGHTQGPMDIPEERINPRTPCTLDLRYL